MLREDRKNRMVVAMGAPHFFFSHTCIMPNWRKGYQGPQRKYVSMRARRARARNLLRRRLRRRYKRNRKIRPSVKSLARSVRKLYQRDDKKFYYTHINNLLVTGGPALGQQFQGIFDLTAIPYAGSTDPNTGQPYPGYQAREPDSAQCNLRNIRIHMTLHASYPTAYRNQKVFVALVKSRVGVGSAAGITCPLMTDVWDYTGAGAGNLLALWELFRNTQAEGAELLDNDTFKILKQWTMYLQPQQGDMQQSLRTTTNTAAPPGTDTGTIISLAPAVPPALPANYNYAKTRPSEVLIKYTHKCLNAKLQFANTTTNQTSNVKYFLVMCGNGVDVARGFNINASIKTNFIDE